ncbi:class I SAM-dependent methyltransferase [Kineosporia sp. J2-2]|uniref:Class I SAM-dependent methyltransferase n=1 Tax=Kineosporia corallincola TaxID=2835133 RepID=A0ABS5TPN4_9ACTN|nr:class I SAM-dependent methyltransferase [Kineosporia corallincola]MBT0772151.1 class I SAM-dependent methyltransferase [Kineosporia corallincola]
MRETDFDQRYQDDIDPWNYRGSWYEQRKYAITTACLPRERYRLAWEPACSIGVLTRLLATRADRVVASDLSPTAIAAAREAPAPPNVEFGVRRLPADPGLSGADLVVLSEILYYLGPSERDQVLRQAWDVLGSGGDLIVVHWRSSSEDTHLSGDETHAWVRAQPGWRHLITHQDEEFVLDVLRRP